MKKKILVTMTLLALVLGMGGLAIAGSLFAVDTLPSSPTGFIVEYDELGTFIREFQTPVTAYPGSGLAFCAAKKTLFFATIDPVDPPNNDNTIWQYDMSDPDPATWVWVEFLSPSDLPPGVGSVEGLACSGTKLFFLDAETEQIFEIDIDNPTSINTYSTAGLSVGRLFGGLAGGKDVDEISRLFSVAIDLTTFTQSIVELQLGVGSVQVVKSFAAPETIFGLAFDGTILYAGSVQSSTVFLFNPFADPVETFPFTITAQRSDGTPFPVGALAAASEFGSDGGTTEPPPFDLSVRKVVIDFDKNNEGIARKIHVGTDFDESVTVPAPEDIIRITLTDASKGPDGIVLFEREFGEFTEHKKKKGVFSLSETDLKFKLDFNKHRAKIVRKWVEITEKLDKSTTLVDVEFNIGEPIGEETIEMHLDSGGKKLIYKKKK